MPKKIDQKQCPPCPKCCGWIAKKNGFRKYRNLSPAQRWRCKGCGYQFIEEWHREYVPPAKWEVAERLILQGKLTVQEIATATGISRRSVYHRKQKTRAEAY